MVLLLFVSLLLPLRVFGSSADSVPSWAIVKEVNIEHIQDCIGEDVICAQIGAQTKLSSSHWVADLTTYNPSSLRACLQRGSKDTHGTIYGYGGQGTNGDDVCASFNERCVTVMDDTCRVQSCSNVNHGAVAMWCSQPEFSCTEVLGGDTEQRSWCCRNKRIGCSFNCSSGEGWSSMKQQWCCEHENTKCPATLEDCLVVFGDGTFTFDPDVDMQWCRRHFCTWSSVMQKSAVSDMTGMLWSEKKDKWCYTSAWLRPDAFDCEASQEWSPIKREWCCANKGKRCSLVDINESTWAVWPNQTSKGPEATWKLTKFGRHVRFNRVQSDHPFLQGFLDGDRILLFAYHDTTCCTEKAPAITWVNDDVIYWDEKILLRLKESNYHELDHVCNDSSFLYTIPVRALSDCIQLCGSTALCQGVTFSSGACQLTRSCDSPTGTCSSAASACGYVRRLVAQQNPASISQLLPHSNKSDVAASHTVPQESTNDLQQKLEELNMRSVSLKSQLTSLDEKQVLNLMLGVAVGIGTLAAVASSWRLRRLLTCSHRGGTQQQFVHIEADRRNPPQQPDRGRHPTAYEELVTEEEGSPPPSFARGARAAGVRV
eukprot:TRINITY_DN56615_c0_g1_i1.p1 TRINITY_DN56615_c0_g1~~TRINITY_DN56615_c0_g1_i1.p1  ORF type:complete len:599 (-),score=66.19 TRINITY_DN56615_c0_g1_i1:42-1838(-)